MEIDFSKLDLSLLDKLSPEEKAQTLSILKEYATSGNSKKYEDMLFADYEEIPVDIDTFLHDPMYLGKGLIDGEGRFTVFPYWVEVLKKIFPNNIETKYNTLVLTGGIGLGKSFMAVLCMLYLLYRMMCLKDPYTHYGLQPIDKITFSLINITLDAAKGVAWDKMQQLLQSSEWFMSHGTMRGTANLAWTPPKGIELIVGSQNRHVIGRAVFSNFTDEVNFGVGNNIEKLKQKQKTLISQVDARMQSRFMKGTKLPTLQIIASSKNSEQSFLETYIELKRRTESKTTLIIDEPQWVIRNDKDSPIKFWVAVGNKFLASEVLPKNATDELVSDYRKKGYNMLQVPIGYYQNFIENVDIALTDIAGISTSSSMKFISGAKWNELKNSNRKNPFTKEVLEIGNSPTDTQQYYEFFDMSRIDRNLIGKPMFIHLDMSISGDRTGITGVWITQALANSADQLSKSLFFKVAFDVAIKAPKGFQISFDKNRQFIKWLRQQGFSIKGITSDTFQSAQLQQQLKADGFNVDILSVDRLSSVDTDGVPDETGASMNRNRKVCLPYQYLKTAIYERKIDIYEKCDLLTDEIVGLERESDGHINHPENGTQGCFTGDTKVSLVDGRELTMLELVDEFNSGKDNFVYSFNHDIKTIEPRKIENAWKTIENAPLLKLTLDNGEEIKCTPNHRFMLRDGQYIEAQNLIPGDSLMPLYRKYPSGRLSNYRLYYEPIEDSWHYEHRKFAQDILDEKYLVHHKNCNSKDNTPNNLIWCSKEAHQKIHSELSTGAHSDVANEKRISSLKKWYQDPAGNIIRSQKKKKLHEANLKQHGRTEQQYQERQLEIQKQHERGKSRQIYYEENKLKKQAYIQNIESVFNIKWDELSANERDSYSVKYQRLMHPETVQQISKKVSENHAKGKYQNAKDALSKSNDESKMLKELYPDIDYKEFENIFGFDLLTIPSRKRAPWFTKYRKIKLKLATNHKVVSVEFLQETADVYDLTIAGNHNFALSAGVFVHNSKDIADSLCGAIYNASSHAEEFAYDYGEHAQALLEMNTFDVDQTDRNQLALAMEEELKALAPRYVHPSDADLGTLNYSLYNDYIIL